MPKGVEAWRKVLSTVFFMLNWKSSGAKERTEAAIVKTHDAPGSSASQLLVKNTGDFSNKRTRPEYLHVRTEQKHSPA